MDNEIVSIAIHSGKKEYIPLVENLLKSFLVCNFYKNIEIVLIESAGNKDVREWFSILDLNDYFKLFDGRISSIKKNKNISIKKTLLFNDFKKDIPWNVCYMQSLKDSIDASSGKYFVYLAEDNQFTIVGDIIGEYIDALSAFDSKKSIIHFNSTQLYKLFKSNNRYEKSIKNKKIDYFRAEYSKWCPFAICDKSIYKSIGELNLPTEKDPHFTINDYTRRFLNFGGKRYYSKISPGVWFHNNDRDKILNSIIENSKINPDYIFINPTNIENIIDTTSYKNLNRPLSTDDFMEIKK